MDFLRNGSSYSYQQLHSILNIFLCGEYFNEIEGRIIPILQCDICTATQQEMDVKTDAICELAKNVL
jgi:hypothetical protein